MKQSQKYKLEEKVKLLLFIVCARVGDRIVPVPMFATQCLIYKINLEGLLSLKTKRVPYAFTYNNPTAFAIFFFFSLDVLIRLPCTKCGFAMPPRSQALQAFCTLVLHCLRDWCTSDVITYRQYHTTQAIYGIIW